MLKPALGTGVWVSSLLGTVVSSAAVAAIIRNGLSIELHGVPAQAYNLYTKARDPIFDLVLGWLPFRVPPLIRDLVVIYLLIGLMSARAWIKGEPGGNQMSRWPRFLYQARLTLIWPKVVALFLRIIRMHGLLRPIPQDHYARPARAIFWLFLVNLLACAAAVSGFFAWSYIVGTALA